jgi:hypothetical protein
MKRDPNSPLGPGVAADRVIALRAEIDHELSTARAAVILRFDRREAAILRRVPEEQRPLCRSMIAAAASARAPLAENPGPELPSPRDGAAITPHDWTAEEHLAAVREPVIDAEFPETDEPDPADPANFAEDPASAQDCRPPVEVWTAADFERNGWKRMPDGNYAPPRLAEEPAPLEPGAVVTVNESLKPKRQREARRA